ncbi:MAG: carboxypeptidase regulatory-like domain-containing protein [Bryobacteraceae bacterium]|nr:carboxypeptidase regulatory-like domain-containing protein [Bryobacteraceae bacterium]
MRRGAAWLSLLLVLPAAAQTASYAIAGRVVEAVTGAPMARTTVRINDYSGRSVVATTQTTAEGEFRFDGLARGKYSLYAENQAYGTQLFGTKLRGARYGSAVAVGPGLDSEHLVFQMIPGGVIKGVVRDADSDPTPRMHLVAYRLMGQLNRAEGVQAASTNDRGEYRFHGLPQGRYIVAGSGTPWYAQYSDGESASTYPLTFHPGTTRFEDAAAVEVTPGSEAEADLVVTPSRAVNLTVRMSGFECTERTVAVLSVIMGATEMMATSYRMSPMPERAEGQADGVPACRLWAGAVTPGQYMLSMSGGLTDWAYRRTMEVREGQETVEMQFVPTATVEGRLSIKGTVRRAPMIGLRVEGSPRSLFASVQADGSFRFGGAPAETYQVFVGDLDQYAITAMQGQGAKMAGGAIVVPETGKVELNLTIDTGARDVPGRALKGDQPAAGVFAILVPKEEVRRGVGCRMDQTDTDGTFRWQAVAPGDYIAFTFANGNELDFQNPALLPETHPEAGVAVTVQNGLGETVELKLQD